MSRKNQRDARLERGDDLLEKRGVDLDAPDDELLPALVAAIGVDPDGDLTIAELLGSIALEKSAQELLAWEARDPADKDLKREIRRSLFRLQQRGIAAAARPEAPSEPVRIAQPVEVTGYLSPVDMDGTRVSWLTRPRPEGGLYAMCGIINDAVGMRRVDSYLPNKTQFKEVLADMAAQGAPLVQVPAKYVDWLMSRAYKRGAPRGEQGGGYPLLRADFYTKPAEPVVSPLRDVLPEMPAEEESRLLPDSARLMSEHEMDHWLLPEEMMKEHHARFKEAQSSTVVINREQMTARLTQIIDAAFDDVVGNRARSLYADRMAEMALWFALAGRPLPAALCDAVRGALADAARSLEKVSFLRALAFRSFLHLMPQPEPDQPGGAEGGESGTSPLVSPSGSGLIIPPG